MWGIVFLVTTTLVMIFKKEKPAETSPPFGEPEEEEHGILQTYRLLFKIIQLPSVLSLISILLTVKVSKILI